MASSKQVLLLAVVAAVASLASATQWVVGDKCGWKAKFNETCWTDGKTFVVGDTLLFKYPEGDHTVVQLVDEDDFTACNLQGNQFGSWDSGNDVVQLDTPGKVWFICTVPNHCLNGMKLAIDVVGSPFPFPGTPSPLPLWPFPWGPAPAPSLPLPRWPFPWGPASAPASPPAAPPSAAAVRNPVGGAVAAAAAVVVAAALTF